MALVRWRATIARRALRGVRARVLLPAGRLRLRFASVRRTLLVLLVTAAAAFPAAPVLWVVPVGHVDASETR